MTMCVRLTGIFLTIAACCAEPVGAADLDAKKIGDIVGVEATTTPDGVVRVGWARNEVQVEIDGLEFRPFAGLGSWAAFQATDHGAMVMGDTVVFQDEVNPAMDAAFAAGLEVTALHNHFFYDEPKVYFMHIGGHGPPEKLAAAVKDVWDAVKKVRGDHPQPATKFSGGVPEFGQLSADAVQDIIGSKGQVSDGMLKISLGRTASMHGVKFGGSMGLTTWMAFSGSDDLAVVDGDFAMTPDEVQPVLRALRKADINIVALHNHMIGDQPQFLFTHFWGKGKAVDLAKGLRDALDAQHHAHDSQAEKTEK